jgi:hypothetical protein
MCLTWSWRTCIIAFSFAHKSGCDTDQFHERKWIFECRCFSWLNERKHTLWIQATQHQPMRGCHIGFTWIYGPTNKRSRTPANQERAHGSKGPLRRKPALVWCVHLGQDQKPTKEWPRESWSHLSVTGRQLTLQVDRPNSGVVWAHLPSVNTWWFPSGSLGRYPLSYRLKPSDHAWAHKKQEGKPLSQGKPKSLLGP